MKRACLAVAVMVATLCGASRSRAGEPAAVSLRVMTYNILVAGGEKKGFSAPWAERRAGVVATIRKYDPDLLGLQEPSPAQITWLREQLPAYAVVTPTFTDSALMYRAAMFQKKAEGFWWHSPTPERRSVGFGNLLPRLCVWARLRHVASNREIAFLNTHFDATAPAQAKSAALALKQVAALFPADLPLVFTGDFNSSPPMEAYKTLTARGAFRNAHEVVEGKPGAHTSDGTPYRRFDATIDHIFYRGAGLEPVEWQASKYMEGGVQPSDHWALYARFNWRAPPAAAVVPVADSDEEF
ncbi:MAG: endonuclease/exonuclease/phosphatase family protein [Planctomycetes bacterium]|nr:endonuclease/exonuclease/phosphatase family protein [Planctomycetota bacterium]